MSDNAVGLAVLLPVIVMAGLLLLIIAWKVLDIARERSAAQVSSQHPAFIELRRIVGADLAEIRRRLDTLEQATRGQASPPHDDPS